MTGDLWENEHGPQGGDEVNLIRPGLNYGWPVIGFGVNYGSGTAIHAGTKREGMEQPLHIWVPSIGISGFAVLRPATSSPAGREPVRRGNDRRSELARLTLDGQKVSAEEDIVRGDGADPRRETGTGWLHLSGHRRRTGQDDAGPAA